MTNQPVDLSNLREAIDHDKELEQELFVEFIRSAEEQLAILSQHIQTQNDNVAWKHAAHALKSTSGSLGAAELSDLCSRGQAEYDESLEQKKMVFNLIDKEYEKVKEYIQSA